ncbi:MAG: zinc ribbon domain-containing protein [Verrucomicrobiota bacterium]
MGEKTGWSKQATRPDRGTTTSPTANAAPITTPISDMPTYEYACPKCGHQFEQFQSMRDEPLKKCPKCGKTGVKRLVGGGAGLIFKGSGFYITDYKKKSGGESKGGESKPSETKSTPSESKPSSSTGSKSSDSGKK